MNMNFPASHRVFLLFLLSLISTVQIAKPPKYSNDFMYIGVGAHNFGVGNAVVANVSDVTAGYWNPAGLIFSLVLCTTNIFLVWQNLITQELHFP